VLVTRDGPVLDVDGDVAQQTAMITGIAGMAFVCVRMVMQEKTVANSQMKRCRTSASNIVPHTALRHVH